MSNEITLKLNCEVREFYKIIESKDFKIVDRFSLDDTYFIPKNIKIENADTREILSQAILIRDITQYIPNTYKIYKMTYKNKQISSNGEIINQKNVNVKIDNIDEGKSFLEAIGYKQIMKIKENDIVYGKDGLKIAVKEIEDGDNLIEVEIAENNPELDTIQKIKVKLDKLDLPLDTNDYFVKKAEIELKKRL